MPAQAYNPLFICGPPGRRQDAPAAARSPACCSLTAPGSTVRARPARRSRTSSSAALSHRRRERFKARFRDVDVLLIDDVQFLERKTKTEEEFFHTFNALHDGGRQIVLTSDRPPSDLQALEDRLRERFAGRPRRRHRAAGPRHAPGDPAQARRPRRVELADEDALRVIAERVDTNVRALEGALIRVVAFSSLTGRPLTAELADEVLDGLYPRMPPRAPARAPIAEIQTAACEHFGISAERAHSQLARAPRVAWPRQVAMYLARELTGASLPAIGTAVRRARPHDRPARLQAHGGAHQLTTSLREALRRCAQRSAASRRDAQRPRDRGA